MCVHAYYGMNTENQGQFVGVGLSSSIWFPGVELRLSVLVGSVFTLWVISYPEVWINPDGGWVSWSTVPVAPLILRVDLPLWDPTQPHSHPPLAMSSAPPQTYLWSFPSSFKINLSKYMCVHACSYKWIQTQHICVPMNMCGSYRKKSGISPCLPPCSAWFLVLCCECQASWPSASQDPDASAFHPALRMMRLQMCATMPGFMWVSLELTLQPPTDILKHWDHTHKLLCLLYLWNFHLGRCYM